MLSTPPELWDLRTKADRQNPQHHYRGRVFDFEELLKERAPGFSHEIDIETRHARQSRCQRALAVLGRKLREAAPDAIVIVGNDQRELFNDELIPAVTVYRGKQIENVPFTGPEPSPGIAIAESGNCPPDGAVYPGAQQLADHIICSLVDEGFDLTQLSSLVPTGPRAGIPHAFGFIYHSILGDVVPPSVPILFNVFYPPNRPTLRRCLTLGHAIGRAIRKWDSNCRVAVIASGGLSHFVIDEELDRTVLSAIVKRNEDALARLPEHLFQAGTSEIKNWLAVVAAMNDDGRTFNLIDYVPCYRSEAGTGNAMAFAYWE
jgi:hypothetical protein